jgi:hypothetical protein
MKLRLDLLEYITMEDIAEEAGANVGRYSAEPVFARTGKGYLRSATEEEKAAEMKRNERFIQRIEERAAGAAASLDSGGL